MNGRFHALRKRKKKLFPFYSQQFCVFCVLTIFLFSSLSLTAQRTPDARQNTGSTAPDSTLFSGQQNDEIIIDTFGIYYFHAQSPWEVKPFKDTLLTALQQLDPIQKHEVEWSNLGNMGSAHHFLMYKARFREGFDVGLHQYDLYHITGRSLPFYLIKNPFTIVTYSRGAQQADSYFSAKFARNFSDGIQFTLDYKKLSQLDELSQYLNQNNRNTAFSLGLWYHSRNQKYNAFISYSSNIIEQEDNGGVFNEPLQQDTTLGFLYNYTAAAGEVVLADAKTRHAHREFSFNHYYQLNRKPDSLQNNTKRRKFTIAHEAVYANHIYKFSDAFTASDSTFYQWFPAFKTDERGMRFFLEHQQLKNSLRILTYKKANSTKGRPESANNKDFFEVNISHTWHRIHQEAINSSDTILNDLFLKGRLNFQPKTGLWLKTYAHLGLGNNAGDYRLNAELFLDLGKLGKLELKATNQLYRPQLLQHQFSLTQRTLWSNDFKRTLETNFEAAYLIPFVNIRAKAAYHLLNNYIYFDTDGFPKQTGVPISISQLVLSKSLKLGHFHLSNTVAFQNSSETFLRMPALYGKHSLYYNGSWFKKHLDIQIGVDLRYTDKYEGYYYNPVIGQFQLENRQEIGGDPIVDFWINFKISVFRGFFKYENLGNWFTDKKLYYANPYYPYPRPFLRFGFTWKLLN